MQVMEEDMVVKTEMEQQKLALLNTNGWTWAHFLFALCTKLKTKTLITFLFLHYFFKK